MSLSTQLDARTKFWRMPEMVEKLLEYLDEISILSIVGVELLTMEVFQAATKTSKRFESKPLVKIIRKALGFGELGPQRALSSILSPRELEQHRAKVQRISRTLLAELNTPKPLQLEILDVICAEHKYVNRPHRQESVIRMSCSVHTYHSVSPLGFVLLEDCEGAIGSSEQRIRKIELTGPMHYALLLALVSRLTRQLVPVETLSWYSNTLEVGSKDQAVAFNSLLQKCDRVLNVATVRVCGDLQMEGWEALALALQKHRCHAKAIVSSKKRMLQARREDLRTIWEAMPGRPNRLRSCWAVEGKDMESNVHVEKRFDKTSVGLKAEEKSERAWAELQEFLDEPEPEEVQRRLRSGREFGEI